jgi:ATP-dependent RNA helicase DeaD
MILFKQLGLNDDLLKGIEELGFQTPTPVQELVIPTALTSTQDIVALAQTGTGKTAAFGLPLLQLIDPSVRGVQALILCPTRELCVQVSSDLVNYSKYAHQYKATAVYGGASIDTQIRQLRAGTNIVVATPGRLVDLIERGAIDLGKVRRFVLDEADEMLNMGFKDALDIILAAAENKESVWLFSATMSGEVRHIAKSYMNAPLELGVGRRNQTNENIEHLYYVCRPDDKYSALKRIVDSNPGIFGLIFCRTKIDTKEIAEQMTRDGYNSDALHGDLSQNDRDRVMNRFREGTLQLLIATDVAARGIDVNDISHVINYGLPDDIEVYTHRSGRTGRAGKTGTSISIITPKYEDRIRDIERMTKAKFLRKPIPSGVEVCEKQLMHIIKNVHDAEVKDNEIEPFLPAIYEELKDLTKEDLIKRFASLEFNRFLSYYKDAFDLNISQRRRPIMDNNLDNRGGGDFRDNRDNRSAFQPQNNGQYQRFFVNIGEMDGINKKDFINLLANDFNVPFSAVGRIDIKKSYMHFDIEPQYGDKVARGFSGSQIGGRKVRIDSATEKAGEFSEKKSFDRPKFGFDDKKKKRKPKMAY